MNRRAPLKRTLVLKSVRDEQGLNYMKRIWPRSMKLTVFIINGKKNEYCIKAGIIRHSLLTPAIPKGESAPNECFFRVIVKRKGQPTTTRVMELILEMLTSLTSALWVMCSVWGCEVPCDATPRVEERGQGKASLGEREIHEHGIEDQWSLVPW